MRDDSGKPLARIIQSYDYDRLMLFFIALLWRASVSTHSFYSRIDAGPHEEMLRQIILQKELSLNTHVSVLLAQFVNYDDPCQTFFDPICTRFEITASPNSLHFTSFAPSICRAKS